MNRTLLQLVVRHAEGLVADPGRAADAELVRTLAADRKAGRTGDQPFAELLRRHGPMVWAVCRQLLSDPTDAEDAFQASFLALVRSAGSVRDPAAVGGWLHGVAVRVARKARQSAARRKQREQHAARTEPDRPVPDAAWDTLLAAVHEEIDRLPEPLRTAFVLCDLQGVGQSDAADRLGWKPGTLTGRLARARQQLLERLSGRGLAPVVVAGGVGIGATAAGGVVPAKLLERSMSLATGVEAGPAILELVRRAMPMTGNRTKWFAGAVLAAAGLAVGVGPAVLSYGGAQAAQDPAPKKAKAQPPGTGTGAAPGGGQTDAGTGSAPGGGPGGGIGQPPMGGLGGGGGFGGGFGAVQPGWEYMVVAKPLTQKEFVDLLTQHGRAGWEFCGEVSGFPQGGMGGPGGGGGRPGGLGGGGRLGGAGGPGGTGPQLVFKRGVRPAMGGGGGGGGRGGGGSGFGPGAPGGGPMPGGSGLPGPGGVGPGPGAPGGFPGGPGGSEGGSGGIGPGGPGSMMPSGYGAGGGGGGQAQLRVYQLKNTSNAAEVAKALRELFGDARVVDVPNSNQIMVYASPRDLALIAQLLAKIIDTPSPGGGIGGLFGGGPGGMPGGGSSRPGGPGMGGMPGGPPVAGERLFQVFRLKHAQAAETAKIVREVFGTRETLSVAVDDRTNSLIIHADQNTHLEVAKLIQLLDAPRREKE